MKKRQPNIAAARRAIETMYRQIGPEPREQISAQEYRRLEEQARQRGSKRIQRLLQSSRTFVTSQDIIEAIADHRLD